MASGAGREVQAHATIAIPLTRRGVTAWIYIAVSRSVAVVDPVETGLSDAVGVAPVLASVRHGRQPKEARRSVRRNAASGSVAREV